MFAMPPRVYRPPASRWARFALATALLAAAALLRAAIDPLVGPFAPFGLFVPAVVLAAWFAGPDGGALATALAALAGKFLFIEPRYQLAFTSRQLALALMAAVVGGGLVLLVTTWRRSQIRLLDLHEETAGILQQLPTGVVVADSSGRVVLANGEIERLLGRPVELGTFAEFRRQYTPTHADGSPVGVSESPLLRAVKGEEVSAEEAAIIRTDGARRIVRVRGTPVRRHDGTVSGGAVTVVDVTELRETARLARERAEEVSALLDELEQANTVKDEFLATLGHELRTPLTAIVGWAAMLLKGGLGDAVVRRAHEAIARNAELQRALIEDVLDVSRIVAGSLRLEKGPSDVTASLRAAVDAVKPQADAKGMTITTTIPDDGMSVWGDPTRLQQVFVNLLSNAVKFGADGGSVWATVRREDDHVEVQVRDDGAGIAAAHLPHIFERFRQADSTMTRRHGGLGLGLAIVSHLVELHGGTIHAESPGEGRGATFTVRLPHHASAGRQSLRAGERAPGGVVDVLPGSSPAAALVGWRVLVVDDDADTRDLTRTVLSAAGATVATAASARDALDRLRDEAPDALLIDISMPGMDGYALIQAIRQGGGAAGRVPAIAFTAHARQEDRLLALASGFQHHLAKPIDPTALVEAVTSVLANGER